jgi:hypothetical protein
MFRVADFEEIVQSVTEDFLRLLPRIVSQFCGTTLVRTYISSILRNCCLEIRRQKKVDSRWILPVGGGNEDPADLHTHTHARTYISMEVSALGAILAQFGRKRAKLEFLLKIRYRLPVSIGDILAWYPACAKADQDTLLSVFGTDFSPKTDRDLHAILLPVMEKAEQKGHTVEGIRRWTLHQVGEILSLLNGSPPISTHTDETLGLLLQEYFFPFWLR